MQRTHRVSLYAEPGTPSGYDEYNNPTPGGSFDSAPLATNVECNLQPLTGSVEQAAAGREIGATWKGFFPKATPLREDMGVVVTAIYEGGAWIAPPVSHPTRFRVKQTGYQGGRWDTEAMLGLTAEAIPA